MSFQTMTEAAPTDGRIVPGGTFSDPQLGAIANDFTRHIHFELLPRMRELFEPLLTPPKGTPIDDARAALQHVRDRIATNRTEIDRSAAAVVEHKKAFEAAVTADDAKQAEACKRKWFAERDANEAATLERDILTSVELRAEDGIRAAAWAQFGADHQAVHDAVWQLYTAALAEVRAKFDDPALMQLLIEFRALSEAVQSLGHTVDDLTDWRGVLFDGNIPGMAFRPRVNETIEPIKGTVRDYGHLAVGTRPASEPIRELPVGTTAGLEMWTDSH